MRDQWARMALWQRHWDENSPCRPVQLFFAKASKAAGEDEIKAIFSEYGTVLDVIIFQSAQGSMTSKVSRRRRSSSSSCSSSSCSSSSSSSSSSSPHFALQSSAACAQHTRCCGLFVASRRDADW